MFPVTPVPCELPMTAEIAHRSSTMKVEPDWIDYNGHLNMAYYAVLFDRAIDEIFELWGVAADYVSHAKASFFTLEAHLTYHKELHADDDVVVATQLLDFDHKRTHFFQQLYNARDNTLSASCEQIHMHIDLTAKRSAAVPDTVAKTIAAMHKAHAALPIKPQVGHIISIPHQQM